MNHDYYDGAMALKDDLLKFMQDIIRIPSLSSREGVVIQRIREEMERLGFDEVTVDPMGNLLGRIGSGPRVIALDGHVDTVDVGNPSLWERNPHSGDIEDGILYGRGASDMKGGVASSVYAGALLKTNRSAGRYHAVRDGHRAGRGLRRPVLAVHRQRGWPASRPGSDHRANQLANLPGAARPDGNGSPHVWNFLPWIGPGAR